MGGINPQLIKTSSWSQPMLIPPSMMFWKSQTVRPETVQVMCEKRGQRLTARIQGILFSLIKAIKPVHKASVVQARMI